jgi:RimJ/RimL family protein N-acetyltransferase
VPLAGEHVDDVAALLDDPEVLRHTRVPEPPPPDYARHWLERYEEGRRAGTREAFAAVDAAGRFLGLALAPEIDRAGREVELGYIVAPHARGRGVATAMLEELTRWAFAEPRRCVSTSSSTPRTGRHRVWPSGAGTCVKG